MPELVNYPTNIMNSFILFETCKIKFEELNTSRFVLVLALHHELPRLARGSLHPSLDERRQALALANPARQALESRQRLDLALGERARLV
jgi:hypothetical protein